MKKILLTGLLVCATASVFAQGLVQFRNTYANTTPPIDGRIGWQNAQGVFQAWLDSTQGTYRAALIGGPDATGVPATLTSLGNLTLLFSPSAAATAAWAPFRSAATAGYINPGQYNTRILNDVNWAGRAMVQMVAWSGNYNTFAEAFAAANAGTPGAMIGVSTALHLTLPSSNTDPNVTYLWGLNSFNIQPVPEPTSLALAGLGAAALLIFRRR